ncbi:GGDEF domain-containing protein [Idiomarina sp. HP20-50]|uniref:GGDEF domain-containing protein n=1 Tax=Idiomarina sp. HP20-50 TaxID=3070813 RepID=UPI00294B63FD|nr:GGDEF domain-containing protein [Idiomarina sp. HP20-50]MDV6317357.1 GGDEF domain-containing protein [Idiomarina sp. HP20-50]
MNKDELDITNLHWVLQILQNIEVGLIVFDRDYDVKVWNGFMENHSGISSVAARDENLFKLLPTLPKRWFEYKTASVLKLGIQAHCNWQQEPHILNFENTRPFTAESELMFQNVTLFPLFSTDKEIHHICALVYDVSEEANNLLKLTTISQTDALTQLFNRGHWQQAFEQEYLRCQRYEDTASVIMMDIDNFKQVNDTYGHQVGDRAIQLIAKIIVDCQRETDVCGRYGGEEFAILLPKTSLDDGVLVAERLRKQIEETALPLGKDYNDEQLKLTISAGVAEFSCEFSSAENWLEKADAALYDAKENGRNQVSK